MSDARDIREVSSWWRCDVCRRQFEEGADSTIHFIDSYTICQKCVNRGQFWAIREAWREECLKKGNDY
jgi:hypothetical protein